VGGRTVWCAREIRRRASRARECSRESAIQRSLSAMPCTVLSSPTTSSCPLLSYIVLHCPPLSSLHFTVLFPFSNYHSDCHYNPLHPTPVHSSALNGQTEDHCNNLSLHMISLSQSQCQRHCQCQRIAGSDGEYMRIRCIVTCVEEKEIRGWTLI
jgi:hypothetical protein